MAQITYVTLILAAIAFRLRFTESAKVLAVFPFTGPSQYISVQPYLKTLVARGHEITSVSAFPQKNHIKNFRDITLSNQYMDHDG